MLTHTSRWSHARGNGVVPSRWQATCGEPPSIWAPARVRAPSPAAPPAVAGGLDPRFDYFYQATAAGYGPYYKGRDTEYGWYTDADSDRVVCE